MKLDEVLSLIRRGWWVALGLALLGAYEGHSYAAKKPVLYSSTSQAYVVVNNSGTSGGDAFNAGQAAQNKMASYTVLAKSRPVTQKVIDALQLTLKPEEVAAHLSVDFAPGTLLLEITATGETARLASDLASETNRQLVNQVEILETPAPGVPAWTRLIPLSESTPPTASKPGTTKLTAAGGLGGLGLGMGLAFLMTRFDPRVRSEKRLAEIFGSDPLSSDDPRAIRARVLAEGNAGRLVAVSGVRAESWPTTRQLADSLAAAGASVLVVDARPVLGGATSAFGMADAEGLAESLRLGEPPHGLGQPEAGSVAVLPSGIARADLPDLLASSQARRALDQLSSAYDHVLVDGVTPTTSPAAAGALRLFVVRPGKASASGYRSESGAESALDSPRLLAVVRRSIVLRWLMGLAGGRSGR
ncbi:chain length determinant protein [Segniliparus rugosus]|uniref:Capsular polysaccharide biosynthesis protein n=1 Tax=Segniliparus rugosus (strain ATCC BAA-974 / DSM 45345 / CCUG 50838 / CIP 108380 / JCM 13579 / CDC 945) TaxID=679197 RepID=E5XNP7_SEGRC|nr:chain length determinant protein [Segniliparus rugosus]EFV14037.1 hypothetical protein HMPREF9336_01118 [Segniliparus rugosus ATCC BAA-974]